MCKRAKDNYLRRLVETDTCSEKLVSRISQSVNSSKITRSQSTPYERNMCFCCDQGPAYRNPLHKVVTENADRALKDAVEKSENNVLRVKLCTAIDPNDAHAIDIKYHKRCWCIHVTNVLRRATNQM